MDAEGQNKKRKLKLDWNQLLSEKPGDDEPLPPLVVITTEPQQPRRQSDAMGGGDYQDREHLVGMTDRELDENIRRQRQTFENFASKLPDKGEKIRCKIERLEEEKERRKLSGRKMDANGFEKAPCSSSLTIVGLMLLKFHHQMVQGIGRDDPESVEICFGDIDSLAPEGFLRSPIMNFYISLARSGSNLKKHLA
ncbi:hypothetical protein COLO4_36969 [Corchorus olitorius]|uniref:Uncharacterized protein n=1 Tax=Corchorus olitorius TaxID=93759 RepID=A0A1R3G401_9ROSI|nr:hypothetical protein COLO4_36969 [Corchorus olitorius]